MSYWHTYALLYVSLLKRNGTGKLKGIVSSSTPLKLVAFSDRSRKGKIDSDSITIVEITKAVQRLNIIQRNSPPNTANKLQLKRTNKFISSTAFKANK